MEEFGAELEESQNSDNEALVPAAHNKLLGAVSQLYEKKRVKASTRKEPSLEVSEFHLSQPGKVRSSRVKVTDLAKVLNKRAAHVEISQKLKSAQKRAKTLPRPLEKIHSDKITRTAGYEHAKQQLNRWDTIVYKQRVAEQISFPLKSDTIKVQESTDILSMFQITRTAGYEHAKQQLNRWDAIVYKQRVAEQVSFPLKSDTIKVQESTDILSMFQITRTAGYEHAKQQLNRRDAIVYKQTVAEQVSFPLKSDTIKVQESTDILSMFQITRTAGYEHAKQQLNRRDAIVYKQRVAEQVSFPLKSDTIKVQESTDILSMFQITRTAGYEHAKQQLNRRDAIVYKQTVAEQVSFPLKSDTIKVQESTDILSMFQITRTAGYEHAKQQLNRRDAIVYKQRVAEQVSFPLKSDTIKVQESTDILSMFQITRTAGYEHAKQQLNRWDAIVYKQRVAEQVSFPLKSDTIKVQESTDILSMFQITRTAGYEHAEEQLNRWDAIVYKQRVAEQVSFPLKSDTIKVQESTDILSMFQITRTAGYEHAKQQLNRWDAIVYKQRVAEQVSFPLKSDTIKVQESTDILSMFRKPTELELKLAELLKEPNPLQQAEKEQESKKEIREEDYPLSLTEVIEKRKIMAKLRAQQSYRQTKAMRHSKIKSKKFHQIQRRARVKEQLKEFEELQKKDPEAALKKLEELERTRAEERVTLRHKSTGQWAKNLAVRARYDKEARIALAEQLSKSKELTVKLAQNRDSESEKEEEEEVQPEPAEDDPNNPWVVKRSKEMEDFVSSYRKYWDTKGKVLEKNLSRDTTVKEDTPQVDSEKIAGQESSSKGNAHANKDSKEQGLEDSVEIRISENSKVNSAKKSKCSLSKNVFTINDTSVSSNEKKRKSNENYKFNILDVDVKKNNVDINRLKATDSYPEKTVKSKTGCWSVTKVNLKDSNVLKNCKKLETNKKTKKLNKLTSKHHHKDAKLAEKMVEKKQKEKTLDELFEGVEDKILAKVETKIKKIKESLNLKKRNQVDSNTESEMEDVPSLEMKKKKISAEVDEKLVELSSKSDGKTTGGLLEKTLVTASSEAKKTDDIDPNKFLKVTPRHLSSRIPEIMTEGEEALDDEEVTTEDRHLTIAEAFAEDDVVDQFQKEKEEEVKKSGVGDVDLSLPGWGSWAGHNMKPVSRRRRKKFIIKFPKAIPRRDINRGNVIINEDADKPLKEHQVSEIPFPFTSVQEYEASVRAPLGTTWVPQTAHRKLTLPPVVTQLGAAIQPMDESQLINKTNKVGKKKKLNRKINKK